ncbi:TetR/AcrR family transcriptional regulator [Oceanobacillus indicireducens]|uniref:HTH-type transcriptional regulator YxaF n=1 Tax=Oceanobacillus indicireducens TaxID=1004261 RepID=A0A917Y4V8_9BACI|nr:TetR/AcrR family transcriptional regulator [Oceanobacillus indicireducens]GGN65257.1 putative HTH-type transcriptional regulator YxaF [Oceanobacillus indicireducens]
MKKNTREEMIKATAKLLQTNGYVGTGLNDIIRLSGAPKGSIYYHFPDGKEQLAIEAVNWTRETVANYIKEKLEVHQDPVLSIQEFILESAERFEKDNYFFGVPITALVLETSSTSENLRKACNEVFEAWGNVFSDILKNKGYDNDKANEIGMIINSMIQGAFVISLARRDSTALKKIANQIPFIMR